jgi:hypothetical protein
VKSTFDLSSQVVPDKKQEDHNLSRATCLTVRYGCCMASLLAGLFAGLTPVLEAAAELPEGGLCIPSSAQERVRQYFAQQVGTVAAAEGSSSATASHSRHGWVLPDGVKSTSALQRHLQQSVDTLWSDQQCAHARPLMRAAAQLVADAACDVAQQQVVNRTSSAHTVLLTEGYRAGETCWAVISEPSARSKQFLTVSAWPGARVRAL